jgi:3-phosphoshikimate 1-carboxyvinyltransferase
MSVREVQAASGPLDVALRAVPSKSVTHRALIVAALARGTSTIHQPLVAEDTLVTRAALTALGIEVDTVREGWRVRGGAGVLAGGASLDLRDSGSSLRFLAPLAALGLAPSRLDGSARLGERPMLELLHALSELGAALPEDGNACLPLVIGGGLRGGAVRLQARLSSQFASALLLVASRLPQGIDVTLEPRAVSVPYVELTARVLTEFGVPVQRVHERRWRVAPCDHAGREYRVEGDHSTAAFFLAAPAVVGGRVRVVGLDPRSVQPDARLATLLADLGCTVLTGADWVEVQGSGRTPGFEHDLSQTPDLVPILAAVALFAEGPCVLRGLAHLRHKESDRLELLARNLRTLGREARAREDRLEVGPPPPALSGATVETGSDHRLAMAFAVAGLRLPGTRVREPTCVAKSHPGFWDDFEKLEG